MDSQGHLRHAVFCQGGQGGQAGTVENRPVGASLRRFETLWHRDGTALAQQWHRKPSFGTARVPVPS